MKIQRSAEFENENEVVFMCPECYNLFTLKSAFINIGIESDNAIINIYPLTQYSLSTHISLQCSNCHNYMVQVDSGIANTLVQLNEKGYQTRFSCSGHPNGSVYPYITLGYADDEYWYANDEDKQQMVDYTNRIKQIFREVYEKLPEDVQDLLEMDDDCNYKVTIRLKVTDDQSHHREKTKRWLAVMNELAEFELPFIN